MSRNSQWAIGLAAAAGAALGIAAGAGANLLANAMLNRRVTRSVKQVFTAQPCGLPAGDVADEALRSQMEATSLAMSQRVGEWLSSADVEQVDLPADSGELRLVGDIVYAQRASRQWVVLAHDYRDNRRSMEKFAEMYARHGFNVLNVDLRAHGESEGAMITMGWTDGQDIVDWVGYLVGRFGADIRIVLHGVSMGAAAVVNASSWTRYPQIVAVVADSCPARIRECVLSAMRRIVVAPPGPLFAAANLAFRVRGGFDLSKANPIDTVRRSTLPSLFIHGASDTLVEPSQAAELYSACGAASKKLYVVPGAIHAASAFVDPQAYEDTVFEFLGRVGACARATGE
jgi:alpha-beta hydrolase superfamily lysophospholipase